MLWRQVSTCQSPSISLQVSEVNPRHGVASISTFKLSNIFHLQHCCSMLLWWQHQTASGWVSSEGQELPGWLGQPFLGQLSQKHDVHQGMSLVSSHGRWDKGKKGFAGLGEKRREGGRSEHGYPMYRQYHCSFCSCSVVKAGFSDQGICWLAGNLSSGSCLIALDNFFNCAESCMVWKQKSRRFISITA